MQITLTLFLLFGTCTLASGQRKEAPACRANKVALEPVGITERPSTSCGEKDYYTACDKAISQLDTNCQKACGHFKKRGQESAPAGTGECKADPVDATVTEFKPEFCKEFREGQNPNVVIHIVSCIVSAACSCDP